MENNQIKGYLENISPTGLIHGWAINPVQPEAPATVYIYINQQLHTVVEADLMREDLKSEGMREGRAGFTVDAAGAQVLHQYGKMEIRAYLDFDRKQELNNSPLYAYAGETGYEPGEIDPELGIFTALVTETRTINCYFEGINSRGELYGWACDPQDIHYKPTIHLFHEQYPLGICQSDQFRGDLKAAGITNGEAGFTLGISDWELHRFTPGTKIHAYLDNTGIQELQNSPYVLTEEVCQNIKSVLDSAQLKRLVGTLDEIKNTGEIIGWARDPRDPHYRASVYFFSGGILLGCAKADEYRGDLRDAGLNEGKCAFAWRDFTFNGLCALSRNLQVKAYFDDRQHRELSNSPARIARSAFKKIWKSVLDTERMDTRVETRTVLLREMLTYRQSMDVSEGITSEDVYHYALQTCFALYNTRQYQALLNTLTDELIEYRRQNGLPVFDLIFYRLLALLASGTLDMEVLQGYEGLVYRQIEATNKMRRAQPGNDTDDDEDTETDIDDEDNEADEAESSADLKSGLTKNRKVKKTKLDSILERYRKYISQACVENFNQVIAGFYTHQDETPERYGLQEQYILLVAKCLTYIYQDYHLAVNYISIMGRDNLKEKSADIYILAGRISQQLGYNYEALQYFIQASKTHQNSWLACTEAGFLYGLICQNRIELYRQKCREVAHLLAEGLRLNPQQSKGYKYAAKFFKAFASESLKYTRQLADFGEEKRALQERQNDLTCLADVVIDFNAINRKLSGVEPSGKPQQKRYGTIVFMASQSLWQCFYYRAKQKLDHARALGWNTRYVDFNDLSRQDWKKELMYGDLLYLCRLPSTYEVLNVIGYARSLNIPIIYDLDDLIFDERYFPSPLESYAGTIDNKLYMQLWMDNPLFKVALQQADRVTCSTFPLAEQIRSIEGFDQPVTLYPNLLSEELRINAQKHQDQMALTQVSGQPVKDTVEIFYGSATKAHKQVFYQVLCPALAVVMAQHPAVRLTLVGYFTLPGRLEGYSDRINVIAPTPNYMGYIGRLKQADINIAILEQDVFTDCKSELKWFEAGAFSIPSVVTPTATYRHVLKPEENVLFATDVEDWIRQLTRLIESTSLRHEMGQKARHDTLAAYQPAVGVDALKQILDTTLAAESSQQKIRILFVNVFFAPQSIGGATRIVESHIRYLQEQYPDEFEIHVLTTEADPSHWPPYSVEQYLYGDARVTKLRIPVREWAEYEDEKVYAFCQEYYRRNAFDIIHFHSIQMLTASAVDAARDLNIPYLITLHDGWWLSRYLFLMDEQGNAIDPADPFSGNNGEHDDLLWLLERKNRLYRCLNEAHRVLAVSEKFRLLHEAAVIDAHLQTNENGLESFDVLPREPNTSNKVRLAHIGGMSRHKGYNLLRDCISAGQFKNLEILVIDHSLEPGESYSDYWGTTPVTFTAKTRQSEVNVLYSRMDVLLAPSLWPESFGLVTREALYAGIWVIASDRGAVGDAVVEGVNGRVVDVSTQTGLMAALQEIDDAPVEFTRQRESVIPRSAREQAEECTTLYRELCAGVVRG